MSYPEKMRLKAIELKPGRSASQVCRLLEIEFPDEPVYPDPREIYRWCNAKSKVSHSSNNSEGHYEELLDVTRILLDGDLEKVTAEGETYQIFRSGYEFEKINRDELSRRLMGNLDKAVMEYDEWFVLDCFMDHLAAETDDQGFDFFELIETRPFEMIKLLRLAYRRKKIKGTCPVCEN